MGGAPHGLRKPGEQEVPKGSVRGRKVMCRATTHARAGHRQCLPARSASGLGAGHGQEWGFQDVTAQDGGDAEESPETR
ncbi:hypothetical protein LMG18101_02030 [Ralstonia flaminis]|uniref:Uncharacterized protein n=1 Tax=Ralstonia flaminis TaxID=3058597 RepID=A0ABM9K3P3_9RALS|nr:hypothetical protein LMG18101_02030 [Ralstonia sp. LMG 18101]